LLNSLII